MSRNLFDSDFLIADAEAERMRQTAVSSTVTTNDEQGEPEGFAKPRLPSELNKIPVLYGRGLTGGILTDAKLEADNLTMTLTYIISEKTGNTLAGDASVVDFEKIYINGYRANFQADGITVASIQDFESTPTVDTSLNGLIEIYCFNDGYLGHVFPVGEGPGDSTTYDAQTVSGRPAHEWTDLVFVIVKCTYNAEAGLTTIPTFGFECRNSMDNPGDVLYDYLSNTRYGAGLTDAEINK